MRPWRHPPLLVGEFVKSLTKGVRKENLLAASVYAAESGFGRVYLALHVDRLRLTHGGGTHE